MKTLFALLLTSVGITSLAQGDNRILFSQLMVVFSDMDKNFDYLKGDLKTNQGSVSVYETIRSLEGTKDNVIIADSNVYQYQAILNDSTSEEGSKQILNSWKEKLNETLSGMFAPATSFHSENDIGTDGYEFSSGNIVLLILRHREENSYWLNLVIKQKNNDHH